MPDNKVTEYTKTYTTFSGCDIVATFNGKIIGELQAVTYSVSREKAPVYTMGSAEPRSFSRGKRGIAGTLVFTVFNRDALIEELKEKMSTDESDGKVGLQKFKLNDPNYVRTLGGEEFERGYVSIEEWDSQMSDLANGESNVGAVTRLVKKAVPKYADEILPFDITISFANEYGQKAVMVIYAVELLNEGSGYSIDSVTTEKAYTFVARSLDHMRSLDGEKGDDSQFYSTF